MEMATINVRGMTCGHCKKSVEVAVSALPGVDAVAIDLAGGWAKIRFAPRATSLAAIVAAIQDAGYEATSPG